MSYQTWQDLLEAEIPAADSLREEEAEAPVRAALPDDVRALMEERERLEAELKALIGEGPPDPDTERFGRMYAVPVHTKETRIEERRQRRQEELLRLAVIRSLEKRGYARRVAEAAEEGRQQALLERRAERLAEAQWLLDRRSALEKKVRTREAAEREADPARPEPAPVERARPQRAEAVRKPRIVAKPFERRPAAPRIVEPPAIRKPRPAAPGERRTSDVEDRPRLRPVTPPVRTAERRTRAPEPAPRRRKATPPETRFERRDRDRFRS